MTLLLASIGWGLLAIGAIMHTWRHDHLRELELLLQTNLYLFR